MPRIAWPGGAEGARGRARAPLPGVRQPRWRGGQHHGRSGLRAGADAAAGRELPSLRRRQHLDLAAGPGLRWIRGPPVPGDRRRQQRGIRVLALRSTGWPLHPAGKLRRAGGGFRPARADQPQHLLRRDAVDPGDVSRGRPKDGSATRGGDVTGRHAGALGAIRTQRARAARRLAGGGAQRHAERSRRQARDLRAGRAVVP